MRDCFQTRGEINQPKCIKAFKRAYHRTRFGKGQNKMTFKFRKKMKGLRKIKSV